MNSLFAQADFPELQLSALPAERQAQIRVLNDVLALVEQRQRGRAVPAWDALARFAESDAVAEVTAARMEKVPANADFGSFEELKSRRDATGVVRLR
jgi:hypothetical protein